MIHIQEQHLILKMLFYQKNNYLSNMELLYHQNEISEYIYFIIKGKFQKYASFSFNWLLEYLDYIKDSTTNIIYHLVKIFPKSPMEHSDLLEALEEQKLKSPMVNENLSNIEKSNLLYILLIFFLCKIISSLFK